MKTNKKHSTKNNKASTSLSELPSRSEQLSGNENRQTEKTLNTQNSELTTAPTPAPTADSTMNNQPSTINRADRVLPYVNFAQREQNRELMQAAAGSVPQASPPSHDFRLKR